MYLEEGSRKHSNRRDLNLELWSKVKSSRCNTFDVSVDDASIVEGVDGFKDISGVLSDHGLGETLAGDAPQGALVAVLHKQV